MAIASDISIACSGSSLSGFQGMYLTEVCNITAATASTSAHTFTAITQSTDAFHFEAQHKSATLEITQGDESTAQTVVYTQQLLNPSSAQKKTIQDAINARRVAAVLETRQSTGTYYKGLVIGYDSIDGQQSAAIFKADYSNTPDGEEVVTMTLTATMSEQPREIIGTIAYNVTTVNFGT